MDQVPVLQALLHLIQDGPIPTLTQYTQDGLLPLSLAAMVAISSMPLENANEEIQNAKLSPTIPLVTAPAVGAQHK
jgi:hypothetical protein